MFPHLAPWGEIWLWDMSECDLGEADGFLQLFCNPGFWRITSKNLLCIHKPKKGISQKYNTAFEAAYKHVIYVHLL